MKKSNNRNGRNSNVISTLTGQKHSNNMAPQKQGSLSQSTFLLQCRFTITKVMRHNGQQSCRYQTLQNWWSTFEQQKGRENTLNSKGTPEHFVMHPFGCDVLQQPECRNNACTHPHHQKYQILILYEGGLPSWFGNMQRACNHITWQSVCSRCNSMTDPSALMPTCSRSWLIELKYTH